MTQSASAVATQPSVKPTLSFSQILSMNFGFFGIQYSFGLQQANMTPIYSYLGADESKLPLLWLAGPMTGLLVQPIIGAMSDRTGGKYGRRTPYFLIGAIICSLMLLAMPYSSALWMAASILWILDAANNVTMEPYRAYVNDRLNKEQHSLGFLSQSAFTGAAQTIAYLTPSILVWLGFNKDELGASGIPKVVYIAFFIGAFMSFASVYFSIKTVPELPLTKEEQAAIDAKPKGIAPIFKEIWEATKDMPKTMRDLWWMCLFQWFGMLCYWIYIVPALAASMFNTRDASSAGFRDAGLLNGQIGGFYNAVACLAAFALVPLALKHGAKMMHTLCLIAAGLGMLWLPSITSKWLLFVPMIGIGFAWASIMGNPYIMLAGSIPPERAGVYMGIFNMFIVIPMLIQGAIFGSIYEHLLGNDPRNAIRFAGVFLLIAAAMVWRVKTAAEK